MSGQFAFRGKNMKLHLLILTALTASLARAYTNSTLNISACGGTMSGGGYANIGSICSIGGQDMQSASYYNYSGFVAGFILQPGTAFSGLPDEWNPDNDRDGLLDSDEIIAGSSLYKSDTDGDGLPDADEVHTYGTSPALTDSDEDGMNDAGELIAGTSPTNRSSVLAVTCTTLPNGQKQLSWFGMQGHTYIFQYTDSLNSGDWQSYPLDLTGYGSTISLTDTETSSNRFYRVKVRGSE